jgi:hypothetical protein
MNGGGRSAHAQDGAGPHPKLTTRPARLVVVAVRRVAPRRRPERLAVAVDPDADAATTLLCPGCGAKELELRSVAHVDGAAGVFLRCRGCQEYFIVELVAHNGTVSVGIFEPLADL